MPPIAFVTFQLLVLTVASIVALRRSPSPTFKALYLAAYCGVIGMDVWYFANFAYPAGFSI